MRTRKQHQPDARSFTITRYGLWVSKHKWQTQRGAQRIADEFNRTTGETGYYTHYVSAYNYFRVVYKGTVPTLAPDTVKNSSYPHRVSTFNIVQPDSEGED